MATVPKWLTTFAPPRISTVVFNTEVLRIVPLAIATPPLALFLSFAPISSLWPEVALMLTLP